MRREPDLVAPGNLCALIGPEGSIDVSPLTRCQMESIAFVGEATLRFQQEAGDVHGKAAIILLYMTGFAYSIFFTKTDQHFERITDNCFGCELRFEFFSGQSSLICGVLCEKDDKDGCYVTLPCTVSTVMNHCPSVSKITL